MELSATTREILGKKVRFLRRQGITPVHLFSHNIESMALQCDTALLNFWRRRGANYIHTKN